MRSGKDMRRFIAVIATTLAFTSFGAALAATEKVDVCHVPPGDPGNAHTITVGEPAVDAHLAHDDYLGTCSETGNRPPEADAGPDQCLLLGDEATLDGSESSDPDDDPLTFAWSVDLAPDGSTVAPVDPTSDMTSMTPDLLGEYEISLEVDDGEFTDDDSATVRVTMDVQLDADTYSLAMGEAVEVTVTLHTAAPAGGVTLTLEFDDELVAVTTAEDGTGELESLVFSEGEQSLTVWLQGLAAGETDLTVTAGTTECFRSDSATVTITLPVELQELLDEVLADLGTNSPASGFDLDSLLTSGDSSNYGDSDAWEELREALSEIEGDLNAAVGSLLGNG
jgi:hypothetical protein